MQNIHILYEGPVMFVFTCYMRETLVFSGLKEPDLVLKSLLSNNVANIYSQCRIQQFFWGACFSTSSEEKTVVQLESLGGGGSCKPSSVGSRGEAPENFDYFAFWIA